MAQAARGIKAEIDRELKDQRIQDERIYEIMEREYNRIARRRAKE